MSDPTLIGPGPSCPECGLDYGIHMPWCSYRKTYDSVEEMANWDYLHEACTKAADLLYSARANEAGGDLTNVGEFRKEALAKLRIALKRLEDN